MHFPLKIILFFVFVFLRIESAFTQNESLQIFEHKIKDYQNHHLQEKLFLHLDRSFYLTSETIWFKIYCVDGSLNRPFDLSKLVYVELMDKDNKSVLRAKVAINKGSGQGSFTIPISINSGNYNLRAYTNWMKNFSTDYFFSKQITVVNDTRKSVFPPAKPLNEIEIQFFPEGGNLVSDLESKIAFKVNKTGGSGIDFSGFILDQNNDTIVNFNPHKYGIGTFLFTPVSGNNYKAIIKTTEGNFNKELPKIFDSGYVLNLSNETEEMLDFTVTTKNIKEESKYYYLIAHTRGVTKIAEGNILRNNKAVFAIDKNKLGDGINHFTLFDQNRRPLCERLYFKIPKSKLQIESKTGKETFATREKVEMSISSKTEFGIGQPSDLSLSVFLLDSLENDNLATIESYLWLTSDLKGKIESPEFYFQNDNEETKLALDNLMLTHGWNRFKWDSIFSDTKPFFRYIPERRGQLILGKLTDKRTNLPAANITTYLSIPGKKVELYGGLSNKLGEVIFSVRDLYGIHDVVVQTDFSKDSVYNIELFDSFSEKQSSGVVSDTEITENKKESLLSRSINKQVINNYWSEKINQYKSYKTDSLPFYVTPDKTYLLDAFTRFPTVEEVMREYVPEVQVRKKKDGFHFFVVDNPHRQIFEYAPLLLLDNVPVFDTDKIMNFDPLKIRKLEVMSRRYFNGPINAEGIISYTTYRGDFAGFELDPRALLIEYEGIQLQQEFFSPSYESKEKYTSRIPDFRNLLYWNPNVKTNDKGEETLSFYTSDLEGKYGVMVQGISNDGRAGSKFVTFEVRKSVN